MDTWKRQLLDGTSQETVSLVGEHLVLDQDFELQLKFGYYLVLVANSKKSPFQLHSTTLGTHYKDKSRLEESHCEGCSKQTLLSHYCLCKGAFYCSRACKYKDAHFHSNHCESAYASDDDEQAMQKIECPENRHYVGLDNLGNSCYMNSILQALYSLDVTWTHFMLQTYSPK